MRHNNKGGTLGQLAGSMPDRRRTARVRPLTSETRGVLGGSGPVQLAAENQVAESAKTFRCEYLDVVIPLYGDLGPSWPCTPERRACRTGRRSPDRLACQRSNGLGLNQARRVDSRDISRMVFWDFATRVMCASR
jgi:hypothetical protein